MDTKSIVYIALFAALTAALGLMPPISFAGLALPPITAQSLGVMLAGSIAGARRGGLAMLLFIALVAVGLPLLAGGRGGFGVFAGASGGFLLAWPISAAVIGYLIGRAPAAGFTLMAPMIAFGGIIVMYAVGIPWMAAVAGLPLTKAVTIMLAYVPGDLVKVILATIITRGVRRAYPAL
ncbi:biotin transport system substrate-specific component [Shimia gijangensis]|uniref:Biotin transporter n=1 Tax=Shimia gijangensis TaxID=1470563 RepID=A0A1M6RA60_9RHOB|nr:biotin transporter BioY [Shimia gijangensis]SHK29218.1 biotin transport system substrate-specific component [Shimia gijangensis]